MDELTPLKRILIALLILALFGGGISLVLELKHLANTLDFWRLILSAALVGALVGGLLAYLLVRRWRLAQLEDQVKTYLISVTLAAVLFPLLAGLSNRRLSPEVKRPFTFVEQRAVYSMRFGLLHDSLPARPDHYAIWLERDGQLLKYSGDELFGPGVEGGDTVLFRVREGFWGYPVLMGPAEPVNGG